MTMTHFRLKHYYPVILWCLALGMIASNRLPRKHIKLEKSCEVFAEVLQALDTDYVDTINVDTMVKIGLNAMLRTLDPYTILLPEKDAESLQTFTTGEYGGIGAVIGQRDSKITVLMLYKGCPAHQGGLCVGDEIIQINREDTSNSTVDHVSSLLQGMPGTFVQLSVVRPGVEAPLTISLIREKVTLRTVPYYGKILQDIGYIKIDSFAGHVVNEVKSALDNLKDTGMTKLVLDLRGNPGGILEEAINIANLFIDQGTTLVAIRGKNTSLNKTYKTLYPAYDNAIPIVVLIDQQSASAAEIVAGVLQDYDRGVLIGQHTFGKGFVQSTRPLSDQTQLKLTISKYYLPSGRSIQRPDDIKYPAKLAKLTKPLPQQVFTTQKGRSVTGHHGITPDLPVAPLKLAPITLSLLQQGLIFDYGTYFQGKNINNLLARDFVFSAAHYHDFLAWLSGKEYAYAIESTIHQLWEHVQGASYATDMRTKIEQLKDQIQHAKKGDLKRFEEEIRWVLQEEIMTRYHFQERSLVSMLAHDPMLQKACALLKDMRQYQDLLRAPD